MTLDGRRRLEDGFLFFWMVKLNDLFGNTSKLSWDIKYEDFCTSFLYIWVYTKPVFSTVPQIIVHCSVYLACTKNSTYHKCISMCLRRGVYLRTVEKWSHMFIKPHTLFMLLWWMGQKILYIEKPLGYSHNWKNYIYLWFNQNFWCIFSLKMS